MVYVMPKLVTTPTRGEFARYLEDYPATLDVWRAGEERFYQFLASLNVHPVAKQRDLAERVGPHVATMLLHAAHHNQVGITVAWAVQHMRGRPRDADPPFEEFERAFDLAGVYWSLKNAMADVYAGTRGFEAKGRRIRIPYIGNAIFETTDRLIETIEGVRSMPEGPPAEFEQLRRWEQTAGAERSWDAVPLAMREELRAFARSIAGRQESYIDPALDVGGFTMGEAERVLVELFARAWHSAAQIMLGSVSSDVVLPALAKPQLVGQLAMATGISTDRVAIIVELLTVDLAACPDPCLTPLVPLPDGRLAAMSSLITPGAMVRNFTARVQLDHTRFGEAGRLLGLLGGRTVAETLRSRLTGAKVAERVKVFHPGGRQAGDFDVVAFDPATKEIVVFEVVWRISPDGSAELNDLERRAHDKRAQVLELREAIASGATARWPHGWVVPEDARYRWFILTPTALPVMPLDNAGVPIRSHRMLSMFKWAGTTTADMVDALLYPPDPPPDLSATEWVPQRYGRYELLIERVRA